MTTTRSRFWWQPTVDDCAACGKYPHRLVVGVDLLPAIGCRCGNTGPSAVNIGVAVAEWNKMQRKSQTALQEAEVNRVA
jgi:hypothetical protein